MVVRVSERVLISSSEEEGETGGELTIDMEGLKETAEASKMANERSEEEGMEISTTGKNQGPRNCDLHGSEDWKNPTIP